jgi:2-dehydro-3-deoxyphosphogluconate aldolase/(4S)-4-hydroxy-2-oxoglutarate aldolase
VGFGIGSALVNTKEAITPEYLLQLTEKARAFTLALNA